MNALVTGAHGFIGRTLCAQLIAEGHDVTRAVHKDPGPRDVVIDVKQRTIDTSRLSAKSLEEIDLVFNLAGEPLTISRWGPAKRERIRASRIATTDILCRALKSQSTKPSVLVSMSAVGIYGERGEEVIEETSEPGTGFLAEVCKEWEEATRPAREAGVRVVNARTSVVIGPFGGISATLAPLFRLGLGARLGDGTQWMSWISLRDEVDALLHLSKDASIEGAVNLSSENTVRNSDFTTAFADAVGCRVHLSVPRIALRAILSRQVTDEFVLQGARIRPRALLESGFCFTDNTIVDAIEWSLDSSIASSN